MRYSLLLGVLASCGSGDGPIECAAVLQEEARPCAIDPSGIEFGAGLCPYGHEQRTCEPSRDLLIVSSSQLRDGERGILVRLLADESCEFRVCE